MMWFELGLCDVERQLIVGVPYIVFIFMGLHLPFHLFTSLAGVYIFFLDTGERSGLLPQESN